MPKTLFCQNHRFNHLSQIIILTIITSETANDVRQKAFSQIAESILAKTSTIVASLTEVVSFLPV
jgi:hypothetical protein